MVVASDKIYTMLPIVFYSQAQDIDSVFKFLYSDPVSGSVESTRVAEYLYNYSNTENIFVCNSPVSSDNQ